MQLFAGAVLASEGYKAPFMAVIKSGECHVLRLVETSASVPGLDSERHKVTTAPSINGSEWLVRLQRQQR